MNNYESSNIEQIKDQNINQIINHVNHLLSKKLTFNDTEITEINQVITILFREYINNNILDIMKPTFDNELTRYIYNNLSIQLLHLYKNTALFRAKLRLQKLINTIKYQLYAKIIPPRSQKTSFVRQVNPNLERLSNKIDILNKAYQPAQRTDEWYIFRHSLLTASSIWKAFGSQSSQNQLIYEKCRPYTIFRAAPIDSPLHWGQKYEPVSVEFYKKLYNTKITDFGCLKHPIYSFIGASPDGINTDKTNQRYGRMLEIKNIVNREINGIPKLEYWIQMQLQMETCDLNECDFLETKFIEYESEEAFLADGSYANAADNKLKGRMILFSREGNSHYEYAPLDITAETYIKWEQDILDKNANGEWIKNIFWKLDIYSNILVLRNKLWFNKAVVEIEAIWNIIIQERITGYEHRAPKKRKNTTAELVINKCYINIDNMEL